MHTYFSYRQRKCYIWKSLTQPKKFHVRKSFIFRVTNSVNFFLMICFELLTQSLKP